MRPIFTLLALALTTPAGAAPAAPAHNTLTKAEKAEGWTLLFDGKTTSGWRGLSQKAMPEKGWAVEEGELRRVAGKDQPGDIITVDQYDAFDLRFEYKVAPGTNSGIKYLVDEALAKGSRSGLGFEFQLLDDERHEDAHKGKDGNHSCGALYDLIPPAKDKLVHPAGEWNQARLLVQGNHIEQWLNGRKVVSFERGSRELEALIAESKYKTIPGFGKNTRGHILLQDHHDPVAFRNIKLRKLKK
jgi:hypothetical protein